MPERSSKDFRDELPRLWQYETQKHYHNVTQETLSNILSSLSFIRTLLFLLLGLEIGNLLSKVL